MVVVVKNKTPTNPYCVMIYPCDTTNRFSHQIKLKSDRQYFIERRKRFGKLHEFKYLIKYTRSPIKRIFNTFLLPAVALMAGNEFQISRTIVQCKNLCC